MITLSIQPLSILDHTGRQWIDVHGESPRVVHGALRAIDAATGGILGQAPLVIDSGVFHARAMLPAPERDIPLVRWEFLQPDATVLQTVQAPWRIPRRWTFHVVASSHTDIGLHNEPCIQRFNASRFIEKAMELCDASEASGCDEATRYRYCLEGAYIFGCYAADRGEKAARRFFRDYVANGKIGVFAGHSGNTFQTMSETELRHCAATRLRLRDDWGIDCATLAMIDMNGLPCAMVEPFAAAGYKNILFAPNQWGPLPSRTWLRDGTIKGFEWNPDATGGGSRIDMRLGSALPRIFWWEAPEGGARLLVVSGGNYDNGASMLGLDARDGSPARAISRISGALAARLPLLEASVPYDTWILPCYHDDQEPDSKLASTLSAWNAAYAWPRFRTVGDIDAPFEDLRRRWGDRIPVLRGEITAGWAQLAVAAPDFLARKLEAERLLVEANKVAPAESPALREAWEALLCADEHSYGCSGYQGRRVFETWLQRNAWVDFARETAERILGQAIEDAVGAPALRQHAASENGRRTTVRDAIETRHFLVRFAPDGGIASLYSKALGRELLDAASPWGAGTLVYTRDNHATFQMPPPAAITVTHESGGIRVVARCDWPETGAEVAMETFFPEDAPRVEFDLRLAHVRDMVNRDRYHRFLYAAFPVKVPGGKRLVHTAGPVLEYARDLTGHSTDTYMAARDWCAAENGECGVALAIRDSQLVEFDRIHPDKTDYGDPGESSAIFCYLANDWLQMHVPGGSHFDLRFRFALLPYAGTWREAGVAEAAARFVSPRFAPKGLPRNAAGEDAVGVLHRQSPLIHEPRATHGERDGQLYLVWPHVALPGLSHYELYRSEMPGFTPSAASLVAEVPPGPYCVARHEDLGLKPHTRYFYRVRAVAADGEHSPFLPEFSAWTRESPPSVP